MSDYRGFRRDYLRGVLEPGMVPDDPYEFFAIWMKEAIEKPVPEPTAMVLATADLTGQPSARVVLLKEVRRDGFVFFTNYLSQKGKELDRNPGAAVVFFWPELERQVRITGQASPVSRADSSAYFHSRPLESRINAIISPQSQEIPSRVVLENKLAELRQSIESGAGIPECPDHWGGYILKPSLFEFWQGGPNRLHSRIQYLPNQNHWTKHLLAP